ncbi:adenosylcobalamin-dependent ribonucleoside-diphosphate reductase [candidate division KSB1 bacterium]|nr:MAG: adenosylcobalamin-dependent ribonucleoside-diphosphate reductase [candidate division KSB1 bacterium]
MKDESLQLSENALSILRHRYLAKGPDGKIIETPADMFRRVASVIASAEKDKGDKHVSELAEIFYSVMTKGIFLPNSPTLMNAGRQLGMLSACFVLPIEDSVEAIFETIKQAALIQKAGGGTGFAFDKLRPTGDYISTSGGTTSGPISFWRVFSEATNAIQQGAFRRGANMGMMNITHPDILKFITAKDRPGEFENFNISVKIGDVFFELLEKSPDAPHVVINPRTQKRYVIPRDVDIRTYTLADLLPADSASERRCYTVADVWNLIINSAHRSGEPGVCFIDRVNADNPTPHIGRIEATNPCGEQPLLDYESCNLGSINLVKFVKDGEFCEKEFRQTIDIAVRFLDNVIDVNNYMFEQIRKMSLGNRKIGLGVMGFADALMKMGISYDSDEAIKFGDRIASILSNQAHAASEALAKQRGCFPNYPGSVWDTVHHRPMRNAAVTTVAPTGTISIIAGCSGGIEPVFALAYWRTVLDGKKLLQVNQVFRETLQQRGLDSPNLLERLAAGEKLSDIKEIPSDIREVFVSAHEISPSRQVQMQATFQKHIDGAISKTINLPADATVEQVDEIFRLAYKTGCKGITVYRHGCREGQPMSWADRHEAVVFCPRCHAALDAIAACSRCPQCGYTICS